MSRVFEPPRVQFYRQANRVFLGQLERNAERASGSNFTFEGHLLYDKTALPNFLLTVAGVEIDELHLDVIKLIDEQGQIGRPERFSSIHITAKALRDSELVVVDSNSSYTHAVTVVAGNERLPTIVPFDDAQRNDFNRGTFLNDEHCLAIVGLMQAAEADIYSSHGKHINR